MNLYCYFPCVHVNRFTNLFSTSVYCVHGAPVTLMSVIPKSTIESDVPEHYNKNIFDFDFDHIINMMIQHF